MPPADRTPSADATPEPTGQHGYTGPHEPQPDGRCKHRWANRVTRYVTGCAEPHRRDAEQQRQRADALEMAVWRFDASRNVSEGREERWLAVLTAMGVCPDCRHPHDTTVCYANVGGATPEPCLCDTDPRTFARAALQAASDTTRDEPGLRADIEVNWLGEPVCARCKHPHAEAAWTDTDPDDGTCWNAGSLVCGCPKFITKEVQERSRARFAKEHPDIAGLRATPDSTSKPE